MAEINNSNSFTFVKLAQIYLKNCRTCTLIASAFWFVIISTRINIWIVINWARLLELVWSTLGKINYRNVLVGGGAKSLSWLVIMQYKLHYFFTSLMLFVFLALFCYLFNFCVFHYVFVSISLTFSFFCISIIHPSLC